jgi:hypothetical protein
MALMRGDMIAMEAFARTAADRGAPEKQSIAPWLLVALDARSGHVAAAEKRLSKLVELCKQTPRNGLPFAYPFNQGLAQLLLHHPKAALESFESYRVSLTDVRDWNTAESDAFLGIARVEAGKLKAAIAPLEASLAILDECCGGSHYFAANARFALARALWDTGGDRSRAMSLAERARNDFARLGPWYDPDRKALARWLELHRPR